MSNTIGWGKAAENNTIGYGDGKDNSTNGWGSAYENSWSGETLLEVLLTAPVNVSASVVSGTASVGSVLTTTNGTWDNEPTSYTYQWKRNGSNILSATANTYTVVAADVSQSITCTVTAINDAGSASATSNTITPTWETDAQAFITAAAITNPTQQSAVNQLVVDLKGYGVWTKFSALYPFVGGTASTHKFNLKDPRDLNVAFRLVFNGGWTHSLTGAKPNGTNAYADTCFNPVTNSLSYNNNHLSYYSRTNESTSNAIYEMGSGNSTAGGTSLFLRRTNNTSGYDSATFLSNRLLASPITDGQGFYLGSSITSNIGYLFKNGNQLQFKNPLVNASMISFNYYIGSFNEQNTTIYYSNKECAFSSIGDGLSPTEASNFYTAVQTFQTTLGRSIGTQTVSDADAQAFVTNAGIVDQVEANAVNNLVIGMKADGVWSKMKAIYPFVGGTSTSHSFNLRNTSQFQITWNGGITHSSTGVLPNGTNGYGQTGFSFNSTTALSSHISTYLRTNNTTLACEVGSGNGLNGDDECRIVRNGAAWSNNQCDAVGGRLSPSAANSTGLILNSRRANNDWETYQNGISLATKTTTNSYTGGSNYTLSLFARNSSGIYDIYSNKQTAFASIGDGLTDIEVTNLNTRVTTFQTALNRQV